MSTYKLNPLLFRGLRPLVKIFKINRGATSKYHLIPFQINSTKTVTSFYITLTHLLPILVVHVQNVCYIYTIKNLIYKSRPVVFVGN